MAHPPKHKMGKFICQVVLGIVFLADCLPRYCHHVVKTFPLDQSLDCLDVAMLGAVLEMVGPCWSRLGLTHLFVSAVSIELPGRRKQR